MDHFDGWHVFFYISVQHADHASGARVHNVELRSYLRWASFGESIPGGVAIPGIMGPCGKMQP